MKQEEKDLLVKDLCGRLPYGVKISIPELWLSEKKIEVFKEIFKGDDGLYRVNDSGMLIDYIKPYLFPLSSMTEEQKKEYRDAIRPATIASIEENDKDENNFPSLITIAPDVVSVDWCNKNHIDYRGLIPMGLALDATGLNIY